MNRGRSSPGIGGSLMSHRVSRLSAAAVIALLALLAPASALADTATPSVGAGWTTPSGRGFALGVENGTWAGKLANGVRARVPLGAHWALLVRPVLLHGIDDMAPYRMDLVGRVEIHGATD